MFKFARPIVVSGLCLMMPLTSSAQEQDLLFTGRVFSQQAQDLFVPLTNNWQARISMMLPEGSKVEVGDVAVEFDGSDVARELESQIEAQRTEQAKTERDIAKLEKELIEAEFQLKQSRVALELATLKADLPDGLIGGLEYAENLLNKEKAIKSVEDAEEQLKDKQSKTIERHRQASLDQQKADNQSKLWKQMLASFSVRARQAGFIIHGNHPRTRTKFQEGDTVRTSYRVAQIADTEDLAVKIWVNSIDRPRFQLGTEVTVMLDALPAFEIAGHLEAISESGSRRSEWGGALYFEAVVLFDSTQVPPGLLPGMSALVEPVL